MCVDINHKRNKISKMDEIEVISCYVCENCFEKFIVLRKLYKNETFFSKKFSHSFIDLKTWYNFLMSFVFHDLLAHLHKRIGSVKRLDFYFKIKNRHERFTVKFLYEHLYKISSNSACISHQGSRVSFIF